MSIIDDISNLLAKNAVISGNVIPDDTKLPDIINSDLLPNIKSSPGGKNTNIFGCEFEKFTCVEDLLAKNGYQRNVINEKSKAKYNYYMIRKTDDIEITFVKESGFRLYMEEYYKISPLREPDEAFIIKQKDRKTIIKILEKKSQKCEGSVDNKLWAGPGLKDEYQIFFGDDYKIEYAFCVSKFLENKFTSDNRKFQILKQIFTKNNIELFFGSSDTYFDSLYQWVLNF